jgi:C-terminal processing protease CtpA/Prc
MRYLAPLLTALVLSTSATDALAQKKPKKIDCQKDLKKAVELIDDMWSFKLFKPGSVDFNAVYEHLAPLARGATTPEACYDVLARFMAQLRDGHSSVGFVPGLEYTRPEIEIRSQREKYTRIPNTPPPVHAYVVTRDTSDSTLREVIPGSEILTVDGVGIDSLYSYLAQRSSGSTDQWIDYMCDEDLLWGPADTDVSLTLRTPGGQQRSLTVHRPAYKTEKEREQEHDTYEDTARIATWKRLESGWGYLKYTAFYFKSLDTTVARFDAGLQALFDAPGLIIDLRGNGGGYIDAMSQVAGRFIEQRAVLQYIQERKPGQAEVYEFLDPITQKGTTRFPIIADPRKPIYTGPVVILIDRRCFSACEGFSGGLQSIGRALVIGSESSGGGSGAVGGLRLPSGAVISFSHAVTWRPDGQQVEGNGVAPDIRVRELPRDWAAGKDRVLERAIEALENGEAKPIQVTSGKT